MANILQWITPILRYVFPSVCEVCSQPTQGSQTVCKQCEQELIPQKAPYCLTCAEQIHGTGTAGMRCAQCINEKFHFEYVVTAFVMQESLRQLIHVYKYQRGIHLVRFLGDVMVRAFEDTRLQEIDLSEWVMTSVPLHPKRMRERYFNQSHELAKILAQKVNVAYKPLLKRVRYTEHQTRLTKAQRSANLKGAIEYGGLKLPHDNVFLIDDVFTTGATVNECAKVLKKVGAKRVIVVCLTRK